MSKGNQKGTNSDGDKSPIVPKSPTRKGAKRVRKTEIDRPEINAPQPTIASRPDTAQKRESTELKVSPISAKAENNTDQDTTPEANTMEVHHHPQLEHKPKPFKEYLLEGFMIFVAVMMGFVAENIREAIDNREHVEQLTSQLMQDLKADTAQISEIYRGETQVSLYNDTLFNLLQQPMQKVDIKKIQIMVTHSHTMWPFHPSTGAMDAIKNELHLKQFSNSKILNYFARYEKHNELLKTAQDITLQYQRTYLDPFITLHFTPANMASAFETHTVQNGQMRNLTQNDLDQLAADIVLMRVITREILRDHRMLKDDATDMLKYITEQFHLNEK